MREIPEERDIIAFIEFFVAKLATDTNFCGSLLIGIYGNNDSRYRKVIALKSSVSIFSLVI